MSHHDLQHALVIALYDEAFLDEVGAERAGSELTAGEREQLLAVDRRALRTDPLRRRRTLRVLADELKASITLALAETRSVAFAEAFFSSSFFRRAVIERGPLAPAFGDYLAAAGLKTPQLPDVVRLETLRARCRRAAGQPPPPGVALAPGLAVAQFGGGVLESIQLVEKWLFELGLMPAVGLCADAPGLPALPPPGGKPLHLLFRGGTLETIDEALFGVLSLFAQPVAREDLARLLAPRVPAARVGELVQSLLEDGLLTEGIPDEAVRLA